MICLLFPCLCKRDDCCAKEVITDRIIVMQPARFKDMQPVSMGANKEVFVGWGGLQVKQAGGT